jgi:hypothetical protein
MFKNLLLSKVLVCSKFLMFQKNFLRTVHVYTELRLVGKTTFILYIPGLHPGCLGVGAFTNYY